MKIIYVVHGFPPRSRWGTEIYTRALAKELSKNHEVYVFYPLRNLKGEEYSLNRYDIDSLHLMEIFNSQPFWPTITNPKLRYVNARIDKKFEVLLDEINPDIVHFQHLIGLSASLIEIVTERRIPRVLTLHDFWFMCPRVQLLRNDCSICHGPDEKGENCSKCWNKALVESGAESLARHSLPKRLSKVFELALMAISGSREFKERNDYMKSLLLRVDKIIAPSNFLRSIFIEYGIPEQKIIHSSNGYDLSVFKGFEKKRSDKLVFGFAGGVVKHKGVHILVEAFNRVKSENAELRIYGGYDPRSNYFRELQAKAENDKVMFMGRFDDVRVPYSEIDVLVVPSICCESFSLVVREAFITQTPVIASNVGALPEFLEDNMTGLLFELGNADDLYEKIQAIIGDPGLIDRFRGNITAPRSIEEQAKELEKLYTDLKQHADRLSNG